MRSAGGVAGEQGAGQWREAAAAAAARLVDDEAADHVVGVELKVQDLLPRRDVGGEGGRA